MLRRSFTPPRFPKTDRSPIYTPLLEGRTRRRENDLLYFAYTARVSPSVMAEAAPSASFEFIAHLSDHALEFPLEGSEWEGSLPTASPAEGSTVWGAVFSVADADRASIDSVEGAEGRHPTTLEVIDRTGRRHSIQTHMANGATPSGSEPSADYLAVMVEGSRHWGLPAGWIVALNEHIDPEF